MLDPSAPVRPEVAGGDPPGSVPRVCLLTEAFYPVVGGTETQARLVATKLNSLGMPTHVLTRRTDSSLPATDLIGNIPTYRVGPSGMKRVGKWLMILPVMRRLFARRHDYDLIYVCGYRVLGYPAMRTAPRLGKACVLRAEVCGEMSGQYASTHGHLGVAAATAFSAWIRLRNRRLRLADAFVATNSPIAEEFEACGVEPARILRISSGVDTEVYRPVGSAERAALRHRLALPPDELLFTYSGKLIRGKGLEMLVEAWATVVRSRSGLHLVLVGSGAGQSISVEDELRRRVQALGLDSSVVFTGYKNNVHEYLAASDAFVFPSERESFGLALVEAMSCGLPVIASRIPGLVEIVDHMENGLLVDADDRAGLVEQILLLATQPSLARQLGDRARRTVCERFSIDVIAARHYRVFAEIWANKKSAA